MTKVLDLRLNSKKNLWAIQVLESVDGDLEE